MDQLVMAALCALIYLSIYYIIGAAAAKWSGMENDVSIQLIYGMFAYAILFFVYVMPLKLRVAPVSVTGPVWLVIVLALCAFLVFRNRSYMAEGLSSCRARIMADPLPVLVVAGVTILMLLFAEVYGRILGGTNQALFVGYVSTAVAHNELGTFSSEMGVALDSFDKSYLLQTYLDHSALVCRMTGLNPLVEVKTVNTGIFILMQNLVVWKSALAFAKKDTKKGILFYLVYTAVSNVFARSQLLPGLYAYYRTHEGKNFFVNIALPLMVVLLWEMWERPKDRSLLWKSVLVYAGSFTWSMSAMFTCPFLLISYIPFAACTKERQVWINLFVCMCICGMAAVYYLLCLKGVLTLAIPR